MDAFTEVTGNEDILDTRDLQERIDELIESRDEFQSENELEEYPGFENAEDESKWKEWDDEEGKELHELESLKEEIGEGWEDGIGLINEDYFEEYAEELASDIGAINQRAGWPLNHIDWEEAADELKIDYQEVTFFGNTFYWRY